MGRRRALRGRGGTGGRHAGHAVAGRIGIRRRASENAVCCRLHRGQGAQPAEPAEVQAEAVLYVLVLLLIITRHASNLWVLGSWACCSKTRRAALAQD